MGQLDAGHCGLFSRLLPSFFLKLLAESRRLVPMELPAALVEQHWEERGFSDEEWQTFMKVHRCLHNKVSKKDPLMKQQVGFA